MAQLSTSPFTALIQAFKAPDMHTSNYKLCKKNHVNGTLPTAQKVSKENMDLKSRSCVPLRPHLSWSKLSRIIFACCLHRNIIMDKERDGVSDELMLLSEPDPLVAETIGELVSIADKIKTCKLTTTKEEFERWANFLKSLKLWGMNVDFFRDRMHALRALVLELEGAVDIMKYVEAGKQHAFAENEVTKTASKHKELKLGKC
ncbi:hypothetical protein CTI12_AA429350 [Artemisia annua]|uniref:Uncharacterized protein n=1 Tax=Artemisia annua TaxID=35608 RepID=A0A2U1M1V0_ARTAN|nr:hypothetical protein CTI12_AA429350 [Artemisia annua]